MSRRYACGHSDRELRRLELQAALYERVTRTVLEAAGLRPGMHVLDIGCGAGDVSLLAAEIVGGRGSVLGIDRAAQALRAARARAQRRGLRQVHFRRSSIAALRCRRVDALVGRFVLMHQKEPARLLRSVVPRVKPGGIVAILESHLLGSVAGVDSLPHSRAARRFNRQIRDTLLATGAHVDMGLRLREVFLKAGLPAPELWLQARVEGGRDAALPAYFAESLKSLLPLAQRLGVTRAGASDVDRLERRLREDLARDGGVITSPLVVGAWCRVQASTASSTPRM